MVRLEATDPPAEAMDPAVEATDRTAEAMVADRLVPAEHTEEDPAVPVQDTEVLLPERSEVMIRQDRSEVTDQVEAMEEVLVELVQITEEVPEDTVEAVTEDPQE